VNPKRKKEKKREGTYYRLCRGLPIATSLLLRANNYNKNVLVLVKLICSILPRAVLERIILGDKVLNALKRYFYSLKNY
jgi:hypothetical protein